MWIEQTEIAKKHLGISANSLRRILSAAKYDIPENYKLINNKRHYNYNKILEIIQKNTFLWPTQK